MERIIFVILFMVVFVFVRALQTKTSSAKTVDHSADRREDAGLPSGFPFPHRRKEPSVATIRQPRRAAKKEALPLRSPALIENEGESVTGYVPISQSGVTDQAPKPSDGKTGISPKTTDERQDDHYARWRRAIIDSTIITPIQ